MDDENLQSQPRQPAITLQSQLPRRLVGQTKTKIGEPAPHISFLDMFGRSRSLADFRGRDTLVLFWDSNSRRCNQILPGLRALEARPPRSVPRLLIVVQPSVDRNQTVDLRSMVVIDRDASAAGAFGVDSPPAAILVDARGDVASDLAAGPEQVLALAWGSMPHARGRVRWAGLDFEVSREVLMPRLETESVAEKAVELARERGAGVVADVGTGSGAIATFLARELPLARVYAVDISTEALALARRNLERHHVADRVELLHGNLLEPLPERPDLIVADLPYISDEIMAGIDRGWLRYEPHIGLYGGPTGLDLYAQLCAQMVDRAWVAPLVFEVSPAVSKGVRDLLIATFACGNVRILPDYQGSDRIAVFVPEGAGHRSDAAQRTPARVMGRIGARLKAVVARGGGNERAATSPAVPKAPAPAVGARAPGFRLRDLDGKTVTLDALRESGRAVMLIFVDPEYEPCSALMPDVARWRAKYAPALGFVIISRGKAGVNRTKIGDHGVQQVLLQRKFEVADAYGISAIPSAIIVHPNGTIASPLARGPDTIRALLDQYVEALADAAGIELQGEGELARAMREAASPLQIGSLAPDLTFLDLNGKTVHLADFRGRHTVLLFWGAGCRFCREMLPDLKDWETRRPEGAPNLLIVLATSPEVGQSVRFRSPVVIDQNSAAARALHASGTPTGVLIDAAGSIGSQPVAGAVPVLELLGWTPVEEERVWT